MAVELAPSQSFPVTSGTTAYPLLNNPAGTTTAGDSNFATKRIVSIDSIITEKGDSAVGTLTISDHAGTAGTAIVIVIPSSATTGPLSPFNFPPKGIAVDWLGIRAAFTGTAQRVRVAFTSA